MDGFLRLPWEIGLSFTLAVGSVRAEPVGEESTNIHVGVRTGYGFPLGGIRGASTEEVRGTTVTSNELALSDFYTGMIPIWLDAGYFVTNELMFGLYGQYGIG